MTKTHLFFVCFCCRVIGKSGFIQRSSIAIRAGESRALVSSVNCPAPPVSTIGSVATHSLTTLTKHAASRVNNWEVNTILQLPTHYHVSYPLYGRAVRVVLPGEGRILVVDSSVRWDQPGNR